MERVLEIFPLPFGFSILKQEREMKAARIEEFLDHLRSGSAPTLIFAVQGGVFSEGVDYPGEMIIGAFVIGPPLPNFDIEREQMRDYYQKNYGRGFDYAYAYPAMAKAVQAAGRVIRSVTDKGLIVLMDNRFIHPSYTQSMPKDWFETDARELVSTSILKEVQKFWDAPEHDRPS
jgi:DNA excision repair protein ERCC-2